MSQKTEEQEVTQHDDEATIPAEAGYATLGAGIVGLTSLVMTNFVDIVPEGLPLIDPNVADAAIIAAGGFPAAFGAGQAARRCLDLDPRADTTITNSACTFAQVAAFGSTAWVAYNQYIGDIGIGSVLTLIAGATVAAFRAWMYRRQLENVSDEVLETKRAEAEAAVERERIGDWGVILKNAGYKRKAKVKDADGVESEKDHLTLEIVDQGEIDDPSLGTTIGIWARVTGEPEDFKKLFFDRAESSIGIAAQRLIGDTADITTSAVAIDRDRKEGFATINILTTDIMSGISEYNLKQDETDTDGKPLPSDPTEPIDVGRHPNGNRTRIKKWRRHVEIIGESQSGKSSLINILFERLGRSKKAAIWVGGNWKLWRMVGVWLKGMTHNGQDNPPMFDWVAPNQTRILEMLATAYEYADYRESNTDFQDVGEDNPTETWPSIEIVLDEAHKVLKNEQTIVCHDEQKRTASMLVDEITSGATSAFFHVTLATQAALMADLGEVGNRVKGNLGVSIAFKSGRDDWLTKTISTASPTKNQTHLGNKGSFFLQQENVPGWLSKADYIRTELIPAMAAIRGHMRGTVPEEHYRHFVTGTYPDPDTGQPTKVNAYSRRFTFGDGTRDEFLAAVKAGAKYKEKTMATSGAPSSGGSGPKPGTPEHDQQVLGLDPNMGMEEALRRMNTSSERKKIDKRVGDQDSVDAAFADLAAQIGDPGDTGADETTGDDAATPADDTGIVSTILDASHGFDAITTREVAIILGLLDETETDDDTVNAATRDAADQVFQAFGLRTSQPRDRQQRHGTSRPRGWKVDQLRAAARERGHN